MKYFLSIVAIICVLFNANANDSLENILKKAKGKDRAEILIQLAYTHFDINKKQGFSSAHEALAIFSNLKNEEKSAEALNILGVLHQRSSTFDSALYYYKQAIDIATKPDALAKMFDNMGVIYKKLAIYDSALYYHQNARKLQATTGSIAGVAYSLNNIGSVYLQKQEYEKALEYYNKSLEMREKLANRSDIAASYLNIGRVHTQMNDYAKALLYLEKALSIRIEEGDKKMIAYSYNSIGNFYLQLRIYDKARECYNKALHLHESFNDRAGIATALNNIGTVHRELSNFDKAKEYYDKALQIRIEEGLLSEEAYSLNSIGGLYWNKNENENAIKYYEKSLEIRKQIGNQILIAHSLKNLGMVYKDMAVYDKALAYYEQSLEAFMAESEISNIASIQNLKGNLYRKQREYDKALKYYNNAIEIYIQQQDDEGIAYSSNNIGLTYFEWGKLDKAIAPFELAAEKAEKIRDRNLENEVSLSLSDIFKSAGNYELSLKYYERHSDLKDSILATASNKRIAEIEFENDLTVKDHEIAKQTLEIQEQETKITQQRFYLFGGVGVIGLIAIFSSLIYWQFIQKHKALIKLKEQKEFINNANEALGKKNDELAEMNEKITDSIIYAKKIQDAILPHEDVFHKILPDSFVFYQPRDIVSGDFYWIHEQGDKIFVVAADCTGHGVPGAFMSMIGNTLLNEIVLGKNITDPAQIITEMDKGVIAALKQDSPHIAKQEDGMEMSLCIIDKKNNCIEFSGTDQKLFIAKESGIETISGNIFPIGGMVKIKKRKQMPYQKHILPIEKGMTLYMLSDGYIDQFGGENDQRFTSNRLIQLLKENQNLDMPEQFLMFRREFEAWKGTRRQIDDVLVIGVRF